MPTISQLPSAAAVEAGDKIPVSQGGVSRSVTVGTLLASTQPSIMAEAGVLLGRVSLGPGGPESITIGSGLLLSESTLKAADINYTTLAVSNNLTPTDSVVITKSGSNPQLMELSRLRGLFSAGSNVTISGAGIISVSGQTSGAIISGAPYSIGALPSATAVAAQDLVGINQGGTDHAITYDNLINGQTIDTAQPASIASDGDSFWIAQGGNVMTRQTFSAVWPWIASKFVTFKTPVVEITANTTIDGTVHNCRVLVCSQPVTLTPISDNMGIGFYCDIVNLSSGTVSFGGNVITSSGQPNLAPGQAATIRCLLYSGGTVVYAFVGGNGSVSTVPGSITNLVSATQTVSSVGLAWNAPTSGAAATGYLVEYRPTGATTWTVSNQAISGPAYTVTGLAAGTTYDFGVFATNASGSGLISTILTVPTSSGNSAPGIVAGVAASSPTSTGVLLSWQAPMSGGAPASYTVQYRIAGGSTWTGTIAGISGTTQAITGLAASTSYDFSVFAINAAGSGPISAVLTTSTATQAGAVTSITWNVAPSGTYTHGSSVIGVNVHVTPATSAVQFGFSTSTTTAPASWTGGVNVNTDLWGAYVSTPAAAGMWYAWAAGTDGSALTPYATAFTVT